MDLKNSEELKSTLPSEPEQPINAVDAADNSVEKKEKKKIEKKSQKVKKTASDKSVTKKAKIPPEQDVSEVTEPSDSEIKAVNPKTRKKKESKVKITDSEISEIKNLPTEKKAEEIPDDKSVEPITEIAPLIKEEAVKESLEIEESSPLEIAGDEKNEVSVTEDAESEGVIVEQTEEKQPEIAIEDTEAGDENKKVVKLKKEIIEEDVKVEKIDESKEVDYSTFMQLELVNALRELLDNNMGEDIKSHVEAIKTQFYKLATHNAEELKKKFIEDGGVEEEFVGEDDPYEQDIKDLLRRYRNIRIEFNKKQEVKKEENLQLKYQVIEEIKNLINREESINKTFHEFRELQIRWREIGLVPQAKMKDLWDTYNFHVENFYDYIKINKELRDLDLRKNMESKIRLCERAEELLIEPSIIKAFNTLQKLHERWREIGPVPSDKKDEIWERFKTITSKINKKHQEFFEDRKSEQKKNLDAKIVLCEKVEEIGSLQFETNKEWDAKSRELMQIQQIWRTIGFAPKRENNKIYDRFRQACDLFFDNRRDFYGKNKELQQNNLQMKIDLCIQAETLKDSTDWRKTTQDFINIQRKWKEIGPIPRKHSDQVWKRFRASCDYFFETKSKHFSDIDGEHGENLILKENLIKEVMEYKLVKDIDKDLKKLKDFQRRWTEIGHVPIKQKDIIQIKFREAINKHFDDLKLNDSKRNILKFRNKVSNFSETSRGKNKMWLERDKYAAKLKQLESDLVLLDNNIGFFAQSKKAESLIADVNEKIEQTREKIEFLKNKIKIIDEFDGDNEQ